jgi:hypothetical protein
MLPRTLLEALQQQQDDTSSERKPCAACSERRVEQGQKILCGSSAGEHDKQVVLGAAGKHAELLLCWLFKSGFKE